MERTMTGQWAIANCVVFLRWNALPMLNGWGWICFFLKDGKFDERGNSQVENTPVITVLRFQWGIFPMTFCRKNPWNNWQTNRFARFSHPTSILSCCFLATSVIIDATICLERVATNCCPSTRRKACWMEPIFLGSSLYFCCRVHPASMSLRYECCVIGRPYCPHHNRQDYVLTVRDTRWPNE